tara:strand:- start:126 stop:614 length:489 start_codon:yes stop_codon:yes gene_type:complete
MTERGPEAQQPRMELHLLRPAKGSTKRSRRIGRGVGSGCGKTSGKGHKGQLARSGGGKRPGFEGGQMPLIRRIPKRGFTNIFKKEYAVVNLDALARVQDHPEITPQILAEANLIRKASNLVKILGDGTVNKAMVVKAHRFSRVAVEKIEASGGSIEVLLNRV